MEGDMEGGRVGGRRCETTVKPTESVYGDSVSVSAVAPDAARADRGRGDGRAGVLLLWSIYTARTYNLLRAIARMSLSHSRIPL